MKKDINKENGVEVIEDANIVKSDHLPIYPMIQSKRNECLNLVRISNRKINKIRFGDNENPAHIAKKIKICRALKKEGKHFVCEAILEKVGRVDVLVLDDFKVIEIANSETDKSLKEKEERYKKIGLQFEVIKIGNY